MKRSCILLGFAAACAAKAPPRAATTAPPKATASAPTVEVPSSPPPAFALVQAHLGTPKLASAEGGNLAWTTLRAKETHVEWFSKEDQKVRTLWSGAFFASALAMLGTSVFAADKEAGTVVELFQDGRAPKILASGQSEPRDLIATTTHLFWTNYRGGSVVSLPRAGGTPEAVALGQRRPRSLLLAGETLYWHNEGDGTFVSSPALGGQRRIMLVDERDVTGVASDLSALYFARGAKRALMKFRWDGVSAEVLGVLPPEEDRKKEVPPSEVAACGDDVYASAGRSLFRVSKSGGPFARAATTAANIEALVCADRTLWVLEGGTREDGTRDGSLLRAGPSD